MLKSYGDERKLKLIGGVEAIGEKDLPHLNVALAQGYSYYFGDDMDLWLISRPLDIEPGVIDFAAIVDRPASKAQRALALDFAEHLKSIGPLAKRNGEHAVCD